MTVEDDNRRLILVASHDRCQPRV